VQAWTNFWFTPISPVGLHALRVLCGLLFLSWLLPLAGQQQAFFGLTGFFDRGAYLDTSTLQTKMEAGEVPQGPMPPIGWSLVYLFGSNTTLLNVFYWASIVVLTLFTLGLWTRLTGVLTWVVVVSFVANPATHYDADFLLVLLAFYLMVGYLFLGQWSRPLTLAERILGPHDTFLFRSVGKSKGTARPLSDSGYTASPGLSTTLGGKPADVGPASSYAANVVMRLIQVQFAIIVLTSALHKLQFGYWWGGVALFHPLHPPLETSPARIQAEKAYAQTYLFTISLVEYLILAWQIGFPFFAWRRGWRVVLLGGAVIGWLGSFFLFRQPLFGPIFFVGCLSYLTVEEWQRISTLLSGGVQRLTGLFRVQPGSKVKVQTKV
jgi:hypothetical protein